MVEQVKRELLYIENATVLLNKFKLNILMISVLIYCYLPLFFKVLIT